MSAREPRRDSVSPESSGPGSGELPVPVDHSFVLQTVMENQRALGELKGTIEGLRTQVGEQVRKLDRIGLIVYSGVALAIVLSGIFVCILDKIWDSLITLLAASGAG